jgi:hypothetical protein
MKKVSNRVFKLSREYLEVFASLPVLDGDRGKQVSKDHIEILSRHVDKCPLTFEWATAKVPEGAFRLNGSHSSALLMSWMKEGKDITCYDIHEQTWECASKSEALLVLAQFDNRFMTRTSNQVQKAIYETDQELSKAFPSARVWGVVTAAATLNKFGDYGDLSDLEKTELVKSDSRWQAVIQWFVENPWKLAELRSNFGRAVVAMSYRTLLEARDKKEWEDFWNGVFDFHSTNDVRRLLGQRLWSGSMNPKSGSERRDVMSRIYTAWKNWREGVAVAKLTARENPWHS